MTTSFIEIYSRSISTLDDPFLTNAFVSSPIGFYKIMYTFLQNAIPKFINPLSEISRLGLQNSPSGAIETFSSSGSQTSFVLSTLPLDNSIFEYAMSGSPTIAVYSGSALNQVTFNTPIPIGQIATAEWYFSGEFINTLSPMESVILGNLTTLGWMEKEKNFLLDIRRLLNDTDFKLSSEANSIRAKLSWFESTREQTDKTMQQYAWTKLMGG